MLPAVAPVGNAVNAVVAKALVVPLNVTPA